MTQPKQCHFCPRDRVELITMEETGPRGRRFHFPVCDQHRTWPRTFVDILNLSSLCLIQAIGGGRQRTPGVRP